MPFTRYFEIFLDTKKGSAAPLLSAKNSLSQADKPTWVERDNFTLRVWFMDRGAGDLDPLTSLELAGGDQLIIVGRPANDLGGALLFSSTSFTLVEDGDDSWYECALDLAIDPLLDAVAATGTGQLQVTCQIQDQNAGNTGRYSFQFPVLILASGITGTEGIADDADPPYPLPGASWPAHVVDVVDAAARLALTTATVRAGDFVREVGRAEVTKLTCLGSTYTAAVAHVAEWDFTGLVAAAMSETELYMHPDPEGDGLYEAFWFRLDGAGTAPTTLIDGVDGNYRRVDITTGMTAAQIAEAFKLVVAALNTKFAASRTGDVVRVTWVTAGPLHDAGDISTTATLSEVTAGAAATHALGGTMLTLLNGGGASVTVGYSLAGDTGDIAVTLPASTRTAAQVAALTQAAIEAHADFGAVQGTGGATAEVTATNAARGLVSNGDITAASAGDTGFTVAVLTQGKTGALTYVLADEDEIAAETGWKELATLVSFSASNSAGTNQTLASATTSKLHFITQDWDTHAQFDPALKRFICRVPGRYSFSLQCDMASASASSNRKIIQLHKNGTLTKRLIDIAFTTGVGVDHIIDGTGVLLDLVAGDYIEPYGYASLGATVYFDSATRSFFQALRVGP
jgi:hypothetical protein